MKKFYFLFVVLMTICLGTSARTKTLYSWEGLAATDWTAHGNITVKVVSDELGSYYTLTNGGGGARGAVTFWGDNYGDIQNYSMELEFNIASFLSTDAGRYLGAELCFLSADVDASTFNATANALQTENYVLDFTQRYGDNGVAPDWDVNTFYVNGYGSENIAKLPVGAWYTLYVDVNGQNISYQVKEAGNPDGAALVSGTATVPEGKSNKIIGFYNRMARSQGATSFGNLKITAQVEGDVANKPSLVLTSLWQNERYYQVKFSEDETLHIEYPDGTTAKMDYWDLDEPGVTEITVTTSGTLKVWTTMGTATSDVVTDEVDATAITLVDPTYIINEVSNGYGKVYKVSIDNSKVTLAPEIYLFATFTPDGAGTAFTDRSFSNGGTVSVDGKGTIVIKAMTGLLPSDDSHGHGGTRAYNESSITIVNDVEYQKNEEKSINFAHLTDDVLTAAGFTADGNATGNWASYGRLYGIDAATVDAESPTKLVYNEIPQFTKLSSAFVAGEMLSGLYCIGNAETGTESTSPSVNMHVWQGVGLVAEGKKGDDMSGSWINYAYFLIEGLTENDFTATYSGGNYGNGGDKDSNHPIVESLEALVAGVKTDLNLIENTCTIRTGITPIGLYRISDAIGRIDVYSPKNGTGIQEINSEIKKNAKDAPIYTIGGMRVNSANHKGIYIQNGKKFVIR